MKAITESDDLQLRVIVAGMHLIEKHGMTVEQIKADGFPIDRKIFTLIEGETPETMSKSVALTINEITTSLQHIQPDALVVHGDRFETFGAAIAGAMMNIPIAHIQGGEVTGTIDESLRHAITKLAHIHFPSCEDAMNRLIRLGEDPRYIFSVGCPMVDKILKVRIEPKVNIFRSPLISVKDDIIHYDPEKPFLLVMFHPVTSDLKRNFDNTVALLRALKKMDMQAIWLWPNADAGAREIVNAIKTHNGFFAKNRKIGFYRSIPVDLFINILHHSACVVGNSSVGLREACYFGTPVVNIGARQDGRIRTLNVLDVAPEVNAIYHAIQVQCKAGPYPIEQVYGNGRSGKKIAEILASIDFPSTQKRITY